MIGASAVVFPVACGLLHVGYGLAEVSLARAHRPELDRRALAGRSGAIAALAQVERQDRLLAAALVGTSLFGALGIALGARLAEHAGIPTIVGALAYTLALAVLDALLPRVITPEIGLALASPSARLLRVTQLALWPLVTGIEAWARGVSAQAGNTRGTALTRQEILLRIDEPGRAGIDAAEQDLIRRVFALPDTPASGCMTPLVEVDLVRTESTVGDAVELAVSSGHTRLLVCEGRVDHIVGVIHTRELLFGGNDAQPVREIMRRVRYVPETRRAHELIADLRRDREPLAVVVDEYGGAVGIVTIEDLLEEIIGEINDERDDEDGGVRRMSESQWRVEGRVEIDALAEAIGRELPRGGYGTVAGLVLSRMGRIPVVGDVCVVGDLRITVEESTDRAVRRVLITAVR